MQGNYNRAGMWHLLTFVSIQKSISLLQIIMGMISAKLRKLFEDIRNQKIIDIQDLHDAKKKSEEDLKSVKSPQELGNDYHPFHAVYISTQNLVSVLGENLTFLEELDEFSRKYQKSEDTYIPGYPPMSPNTKSLFSLGFC